MRAKLKLICDGVRGYAAKLLIAAIVARKQRRPSGNVALVGVAAIIAARIWLVVILVVIIVVVVIVIVIWIGRSGPNGSSSNDCGGGHAWAVIAPAIISATVGAPAIRYPAASPYGATAIPYPAASCYSASASRARRKGFSRNTRDPESGTIAREIAPRYDMAFPFHKGLTVAPKYLKAFC